MRQVILASASPRRKMLLEQMGVKFKALPSDFEEYLDDSRPTDEIATELGLGKALAVAKKYPKALVIGSDTIVTLNGKQLGKPKDREDAKKLLEAHAGQTVSITTSIALVCLEIGLQETLTDTSTVVFKGRNIKQIESYLETGDWSDKAGGWGIQKPEVVPMIDYMEGEYDTILGLPTARLAEMLIQQGIPAAPADPEPPVKRKSER